MQLYGRDDSSGAEVNGNELFSSRVSTVNNVPKEPLICST